jgi:hypothetical protein
MLGEMALQELLRNLYLQEDTITGLAAAERRTVTLTVPPLHERPEVTPAPEAIRVISPPMMGSRIHMDNNSLRTAISNPHMVSSSLHTTINRRTGMARTVVAAISLDPHSTAVTATVNPLTASPDLKSLDTMPLLTGNPHTAIKALLPTILGLADLIAVDSDKIRATKDQAMMLDRLSMVIREVLLGSMVTTAALGTISLLLTSMAHRDMMETTTTMAHLDTRERSWRVDNEVVDNGEQNELVDHVILG